MGGAGMGGKGGPSTDVGQQRNAVPTSFDELGAYLQQIGLQGAQQQFGSNQWTSELGPTGQYGMMEGGGFGFGKTGGGEALMGFDATGNFFDRSNKNPGSLERIVEQNNLFQSDWYRDLSQQLAPSSPGQQQRVPTPPRGGGGMTDPYEKYAEDQRKAAEEATRAAGVEDRDKLYGEYLNAANATVDYVSEEISREQSNAALIGTDYVMNEEVRGQRMQDYFSEIWDPKNQENLEALMDTWGDPEGFDKFDFQLKPKEEEGGLERTVQGPGGRSREEARNLERTIQGPGGRSRQPGPPPESELGGRKTALGV